MVLIFYPADFTFVCPTELEEMADLYDQFRTRARRCSASAVIRPTPTRPGTTSHRRLRRSGTPCCRTRRRSCAVSSAPTPPRRASPRASFIIDPDGLLKAIEIHDNSFGRSGKELSQSHITRAAELQGERRLRAGSPARRPSSRPWTWSGKPPAWSFLKCRIRRSTPTRRQQRPRRPQRLVKMATPPPSKNCCGRCGRRGRRVSRGQA